MAEINLKKAWTAPALKAHGTVEEITKKEFCDKMFGESDGFTFNGVPIVCRS